MAERLGAVLAPYQGTSPRFAGRPVSAGTGAAILGRATLGRDARLGAYSVIRADGHFVEIGDDFYLGERATVHIAHDAYPTRIGHGVSVGRRAVVHACTVGDDCVVEAGAIVLDGSTIGPGSVVSADSVVFPRSELEGGWLYAGSPAKPVARISAADLDARRHSCRNAPAEPAGEPGAHGDASLDCFVAPTARVTGTVRVADGVGIWYGCRLDAGGHVIDVGRGTNIQDNSVITCDRRDVVIGADVTVGHNVTLVDCRVESGSLIGIGALIAPGTVIESDVLVAAGTETEPGQRLSGGHVWAGRPARAIGEMDARKRAMLAETLPRYCDYADQFRRTPHKELNE